MSPRKRATAPDSAGELPEPRRNSELADLVRRHIDVRYDGVQAAFWRTLNLRQQYVTLLLGGNIGVPDEPIRSLLAKELGIPKIQFWVMSGDLTPAEARGLCETPPDAKQGDSIGRQIAEKIEALPAPKAAIMWKLVDILDDKDHDALR